MTEEEFEVLETQIRNQHEKDLDSLIFFLRSQLIRQSIT